jgi:hypothetical protein
MTEATWHRAGRALLGSWPERVTSWGEEGIAAYVEELEARGVTPAAALVAIRSCPAGQKFPPSAPELAALARHDPSRPTFDEAYRMIYGPGGTLGFKRSGVQISPWVTAFVERYGVERLRLLEVDGDYGNLVRKDLRQSWEQFLEATEGREVAALATGRRSELGSFDPLSAFAAAAGATGSSLELA